MVSVQFLLLNSLLCFTVYSSEDHGTFESPAAIARPRFRYWLPDASVSPDIVKQNIGSSGSIGAGGVEFLPFYNYGGELGGAPPGSDWSTYNFGTEASTKLFVAALEAHHSNGLLMDFALGPNQGQGVPASPDDEGLQWDLVPFSTNVSAGVGFHGVLPGWGIGELISAVSVKVVSETNISLSPPPNQFLQSMDSYLKIIVQNGTMQDHTDDVNQSSGALDIDFPNGEATDVYRLFAMYQTLTHHHNIIPAEEHPKTMWEDGSYTVDHFDAKGAQVVIDFWEKYILNSSFAKELLSEAGQCGWEDSMELLSNVSWSRSLPARFHKIHGYEIRPYLPLILFGNNNVNLQQLAPGRFQVLLDTEDAGAGYVNDYRTALANGYQEYLSTLVNWTHELNVTFSSQVSYNLPMDMESSIPYVDIPECESLQFGDSVDGYRQFSATAYLAEKNIVSIEIGAVFGLAYAYTLPDLLFSANRAFAGGVNRLVIHGQAYTGNYTATTWPGFTAFGYLVSEIYSDKQPSWNHGLQDALGYISRTQWVQRQGIGKLDIAMLNLQSATDPVVHTLYTGNDLTDDGWTYGYISPANFKLPQASIENGVFALGGLGMKAMVILAEQNLTLSAVTALQEYADAGFPIILLGGQPGYYLSKGGEDQGTVQSAIEKLGISANVHHAATGELVPTLRGLGLTPRVTTRSNGTWWTTWREDEANGIDYTFVFSDTNATSGIIEVETLKTPYILDAWSGSRMPLLQYTVNNGTTTVPLTLSGNQTAIIAFASSAPTDNKTPSEHVTNTTGEILGYGYSLGGSLVAHVPNSQPGQLQLSSGRTVRFDTSDIPQGFSLNNWTLSAEHWEAPTDIDDAATVANKRNTTHELQELISWSEIPSLVNASGVGYYQTTVSWPPEGTDLTDLGAYIELPKVLHAVTLHVNGQRTPPLDFARPVLDISKYLHTGENTLLAVVPTTMLNYVGSIQAELQNGGQNVTVSGKTQNGLIGVVNILPFQSVPVEA